MSEPINEQEQTAAEKPTGPWVIKSVEYEKSGTDRKHFPKEPRLPEIAFVGRSNVGKSSLLNAVVNRRRMAHVSSTPGRTQLVNFYMVNGDTRLVDLPGYGFAKAPIAVKQTWGRMITQFLLGNKNLRLVVCLFDVRREPTEEDITLLDWLKHYNFPFVAVITKSDKLTHSEKIKAKAKLEKWLATWSPREIILFSAVNKSGRDELLTVINQVLEESKAAEAAGEMAEHSETMEADQSEDDTQE